MKVAGFLGWDRSLTGLLVPPNSSGITPNKWKMNVGVVNWTYTQLPQPSYNYFPSPAQHNPIGHEWKQKQTKKHIPI